MGCRYTRIFNRDGVRFTTLSKKKSPNDGLGRFNPAAKIFQPVLAAFYFIRLSNIAQKNLQKCFFGRLYCMFQNCFCTWYRTPGGVGTGKTYLSKCIALNAITRFGYKVRFYTVACLVNQLIDANQKGQLNRLIIVLVPGTE